MNFGLVSGSADYFQGPRECVGDVIREAEAAAGQSEVGHVQEEVLARDHTAPFQIGVRHCKKWIIYTCITRKCANK